MPFDLPDDIQTVDIVLCIAREHTAELKYLLLLL